MIEFRWHCQQSWRRETRPEHISELSNIETFSSGPFIYAIVEFCEAKLLSYPAKPDSTSSPPAG
jgi:hypothetical protein